MIRLTQKSCKYKNVLQKLLATDIQISCAQFYLLMLCANNINNKKIEDKEEIADAFNTHFMEKINLLKENIDPKLKEDPLSRLKKAQSNICSGKAYSLSLCYWHPFIGG